ncbi:aminoglycoside phosphotransferase family protein [Abyssibius alkaniclasticus]|uniref:aminoglycoside phosphotransferase family protein n=1 Tax=Abyssibius alkaniclasticus TaxID=2881234 RepID=UPI004058BDAD
MIDAFLAIQGWGGAQQTPLTADASARCYIRLQKPRAQAVLMVAPPAAAGPQTRFVDMANWLRATGFSAPEILAHDAGAGLMLLEDFGDDALLNHLGQPSATTRYEAAVDLLFSLQNPAPPAFLPAYSAEILAEEAGRLLLWYYPAATGQPASPDFTAAYQAELAAALAPFMGEKPVTVLRDYHGQNLHWLGLRHGTKRIGLLDFQDALSGHPAYDLAALLGDVRGTVPPALARALTARYIAKSGQNPADFHAALAAFGAQRALKILGLFVRLAQRDGKPHYLRLLPRTWAVLQTALAHPDLAPLARFIAKHIPPPEGLRL